LIPSLIDELIKQDMQQRNPRSHKLTICSIFGGNCLSTSFFKRRSMWGAS
jgi:hypothetical protein